ncbi:MAG: UDP-N-acetylmuramoyl-L-alanine--D-glutamate ligase [Candidatus Westeberhardia cardiocondylae]|nr:UDP-N-acetylmuramoyl-L-alanine--D-glutamate ligase [Candidatus Westeberhardia cardiocondylae]
MPNYKNERIIIVGLGITGLSCVKYLYNKYKILPRITDSYHPSLKTKKLFKHLVCHFNGINEKWLLESTLIIISPGIPLSHPAIIKAKKSGIEIIGDIELFSREINKQNKKKNIIAITGTNGKSTVATMIFKIAKKSGLKVGIGGNIGIPIVNLLNKKYQLYILELSSFQLETTYTLKPYVSTILNISENHINRYPNGIQEYRKAKLRIYKNSKICITNAENNLTNPTKIKQNCKYINFGINSGNYHLHKCKNKNIWITVNNKKIINTNSMKLSGTHNYINALATLALADSINIPRKHSIFIIKNFHGLPHRCELIHNNNNIKWINDSKSTNIESTKAAIQTFKNTKGTLHLILGGYGKSTNFIYLKKYIQNKNIKIYCFGKDGIKLYKLCPKISILKNTLKEIISIIKKKVKQKDIVLFSPACSSTDQFKNFKERGKMFKKYIKNF